MTTQAISSKALSTRPSDRQAVKKVAVGGALRDVTLINFGRTVDIEELNYRNQKFRDNLKSALPKICKEYKVKVADVVRIDKTGISLQNGEKKAWKKPADWTDFMKGLKSTCKRADEYSLDARTVEGRVECEWKSNESNEGINEKLFPSTQGAEAVEEVRPGHKELYTAVKAANIRYFGTEQVPEKKSTDYNDTLKGLLLGQRSLQSSTLVANITVPKGLLSGNEKVQTYQNFALNSEIARGVGINSSNDRKTTKPTNLRQVCDDRQSHYYTGRIPYHALTTSPAAVKDEALKDAKEAIREQVRFMYLSEIAHGADAKGITKEGEKTKFTFAVQSLLSMGFKAGAVLQRDAKSFEAAKNAYLAIRGEEIDIPGIPHKVTINPINPFSTEFNFTAILSKILPEGLTGYSGMLHNNEKAEEELLKIIKEKDSDPHLMEIFARMQGEKDDPMKQILYRTCLLRYLKIPVVIHCKSSLDRTSTMGSPVSALNQYLDLWKAKYGEEKKIDDIDELLQSEDFLDLSFGNFVASEMNGRLSRGDSGLKVGTLATPEILKIMPKEFLVNNTSGAIVKAILYILAACAMAGAIALVILQPHVLLLLVALVLLGRVISEFSKKTEMATWHGNWALLSKFLFGIGALCSLPGVPFLAAMNADKIITKKRLDDTKLKKLGLIAGA